MEAAVGANGEAGGWGVSLYPLTPWEWGSLPFTAPTQGQWAQRRSAAWAMLERCLVASGVCALWLDTPLARAG